MPPFTSRFGAGLTPRGARTMSRILDAAGRLFSRDGFERASMLDVAQAAGVSKGLLHYHFESKEHLLIEAQRAIFKLIFRRFEERFKKGERGLTPALEALDALWHAVRELRVQAPFLVETVSLVGREGPVRVQVDSFYAEAMSLLEHGIREVFRDDLDRLVLPAPRVARLVRLALHGLIMELALARDDADLAAVDDAYQDMRRLFAQFVLAGPAEAAAARARLNPGGSAG